MLSIEVNEVNQYQIEVSGRIKMTYIYITMVRIYFFLKPVKKTSCSCDIKAKLIINKREFPFCDKSRDTETPLLRTSVAVLKFLSSFGMLSSVTVYFIIVKNCFDFIEALLTYRQNVNMKNCLFFLVKYKLILIHH